MSKNKLERNPFFEACNRYHYLLRRGPRTTGEVTKGHCFLFFPESRKETYEAWHAEIKNAKLACEEERFYENLQNNNRNGFK